MNKQTLTYQDFQDVIQCGKQHFGVGERKKFAYAINRWHCVESLLNSWRSNLACFLYKQRKIYYNNKTSYDLPLPVYNQVVMCAVLADDLERGVTLFRFLTGDDESCFDFEFPTAYRKEVEAFFRANYRSKDLVEVLSAFVGEREGDGFRWE